MTFIHGFVIIWHGYASNLLFSLFCLFLFYHHWRYDVVDRMCERYTWCFGLTFSFIYLYATFMNTSLWIICACFSSLFFFFFFSFMVVSGCEAMLIFHQVLLFIFYHNLSYFHLCYTIASYVIYYSFLCASGSIFIFYLVFCLFVGKFHEINIRRRTICLSFFFSRENCENVMVFFLSMIDNNKME